MAPAHATPATVKVELAPGRVQGSGFRHLRSPSTSDRAHSTLRDSGTTRGDNADTECRGGQGCPWLRMQISGRIAKHLVDVPAPQVSEQNALHVPVPQRLLQWTRRYHWVFHERTLLRRRKVSFAKHADHMLTECAGSSVRQAELDEITDAIKQIESQVTCLELEFAGSPFASPLLFDGRQVEQLKAKLWEKLKKSGARSTLSRSSCSSSPPGLSRSRRKDQG